MIQLMSCTMMQLQMRPHRYNSKSDLRFRFRFVSHVTKDFEFSVLVDWGGRRGV